MQSGRAVAISAAMASLGNQARLADDLLRAGAILLEETRKSLRSVENRLEALVQEPLLAEFRVAADPRQLVAQPDDDRPGGAGRRHDAEIDARQRPAIAE